MRRDVRANRYTTAPPSSAMLHARGTQKKMVNLLENPIEKFVLWLLYLIFFLFAHHHQQNDNNVCVFMYIFLCVYVYMYKSEKYKNTQISVVSRVLSF